MTAEDFTLLVADRWFGALPLTRSTRLLECGQMRSVGARTRLYGVGDPPDGLWAVLEGEVRLVSHPAVGIELLNLIVPPGSWFGELSVIDGGPRPHDAVAFGAARVLHVPQSAFEALATHTPEFYRDIALLACAHQRSALASVGQTLAQPAGIRLARTLAGAVRTAATPDSVRIRQEDLAAMVGVSRQTLNKLLKRLETAGLISLGYGRITIVDAAGLRSVGHPD